MMDNMNLEVFEHLDTPAYGSTRERRDRIYELATQKAGLPAVNRAPKKKVLLIAAVLAVLLLATLLAGAGYAYSRYFGRMYREDPAYERMMAAEAAGEESCAIPVADGLELLPQSSWEEMMDLLDSMAPGDVQHGAVTLDGEAGAASAIRSEHFGLFRSGSGMVGRRTYGNSDPQQLLEALTKSGVVTTTLDDSLYTLKSVYFEPNFMANALWVCYEDGDGNEITVSLSYGIDVLRPFEEVSARDVTVAGNAFTLINRDGSSTLDQHIGGYYRVELSQDPQAEDTRALLQSAAHLTVHNAGSIQPKPYGESLRSFPDPRLQNGSIEIEQAM